MSVIELVNKEGFIPWYEQLSNEEFKQAIFHELQVNQHLSLLKATDIYDEWSQISALDSKCRVRDGYHSFRYYVVNQLRELGSKN